MIGSSRNYAIGMAHFQIAGAFKSLLIVCGVYLLLFFAGLSLYFYVDSTSRYPSGLSPVVVGLLLVFEVIVLVLVGSFRVAGAIRTDVSSRMIESHRLMPVTAPRAVVGYVLGSTTHAIGFALLNVLLAYGLGGATSVSLTQLSMNQALVFCFAFMVWMLTALGSLQFPYLYYIALAGLLVGGCLLAPAYVVLPGLALLTGPMIGNSVFDTLSTPRMIPGWILPLSMLSQFVFILLFFAGACRLYRGTYRTTFTRWQGLAILAAWSCVSVAGLFLWNGFCFEGARDTWRPADRVTAQIVASTIAGMMLAAIPVWTLVGELRHREKIRPGAVAATVVFLLLCGLVICAIGYLPWRFIANLNRPPFWTASPWGGFENIHDWRPDSVGITVGLMMAYVATLFLLLWIMRGMRTILALLFTGLVNTVLWVGPLVLEFIRMTIDRTDSHFGILSTLSPVALLARAWFPQGMAEDDVMPSAAAPGLIAQWVVVAVLLAIAWMMARVRGGAWPAMR